MMSAFERRSSGAAMCSGRPSTPALRRQRGHALERCEVLGPAVRVAGVVERVDADDQRLGAEHFGPGERQRQEHGVARRHVGRRDRRLVVELAILRDAAVADQRRAAERGEIDLELDMPRDAERPRPRRAPPRPRARGPDRSAPSARTARGPRARIIAPAVYESSPPLRRRTAPRHHTPRTSAPQTNLWICSCRRTARRSSRIQAASCFESSTPCTGENSTAARAADELVALRRRRARTRSRRDPGSRT